MSNNNRECLDKSNIYNNNQKNPNNESWPYYMCLGYSDSWIHDIRTGVATVFCPCPVRNKTACIQVDLEEICAGDNSNSEDNEEVQKLTPVISFHRTPMKKALRYRKKCAKCHLNKDENKDGNEFDNDSDDANNEKELTKIDPIDPCRSCVEKWCPKNLKDYSDDEVLAEEKHQYREKRAMSLKSLFKRGKDLKRGGETMDLLRHRDDQADHKSERIFVKPDVTADADSFTESMAEPRKPMDSSVIEALENVCYTAKQLHVQIRDLMCKILCKNK